MARTSIGVLKRRRWPSGPTTGNRGHITASGKAGSAPIALGETGANSAVELWRAAFLTALGLGFLLVAGRRKRDEEAAPSP